MRAAKIDRPLAVVLTLLVMFGLATLYSAGQTDSPSAAASVWYQQFVWVGLGLVAAGVVFQVSFRLLEWAAPALYGFGLLLLVAFLFITANLAMGITFSTLAENQLQAVQLSFFFFLPSLLLSGFMFPFRGMPQWAQAVGELLPLTHFLRVVRGILLKGNGLYEITLQLWQIALFAVVALTVGIKRYRQTLD